MDLSNLKKIEDNPEFIHKMLLLFKENVIEFQNVVAKSQKNRDYKRIKEAAHKIKTSLNYLSLDKAFEHANKINNAENDLESVIKQNLPPLLEILTDALNDTDEIINNSNK